jgi:hypothetical protein
MQVAAEIKPFCVKPAKKCIYTFESDGTLRRGLKKNRLTQLVRQP